MMSYSFTSFSIVLIASTDSVVMARNPIFLANSNTLRASASSLRNSNHAIVHSLDAVLLQLRLNLGDHLVSRIVIPFQVGLFFAEFLPGIELDHFSAGLRRFFQWLQRR